jgi:hypothetical protein
MRVAGARGEERPRLGGCWTRQARLRDGRRCKDVQFRRIRWTRAIALYDSLIEAGWHHIRPFRELVRALGNSAEALGLTAVTSHETLIVSPYTRYPDWFEGRHVRVHPLKDGTIRVDRVPQQYDRHPTETWTLSLDDAGWQPLS